MIKNPCDGIRKTCISELMMLIAGVIAFIGTVVNMTTVKASGTDPAFYGMFVPALAIVTLIAFVLNIVGLAKAGKDEDA